LVHEVLEQLVVERGLKKGGDLDEILARSSGVRLSAPSADRLATLCLEAAQGLLAREGLVLPGLAEILQRRAQAFVGQAFSEGSLPPLFVQEEAGVEDGRSGSEILGVEVYGEAEVAGHRIGFRADRVDRVGDEVVFVDYKARKPISQAVLPATRSKAYFQAVAQGTKLQAGIYSSARGPQTSRGRYVFLRPDVSGPGCRVDHRGDDPDLGVALEEAVTTLSAGLASGQVFPRVVDPRGVKEPAACSYCSVSAACVRGDSSARGRLLRHATQLQETQGQETEDSPFLQLWQLPSRGKDRK